MSVNVKAAVTFQRLSGIPGDQVQHDWFFQTSSTGPTLTVSVLPLTTALEHFYGERNTGQSLAVGEYMSEDLNRTPGMSINFYVVPAVRGPVGAPVATATGIAFYAAAAGVPLPSQCAAVLSYRSDYGTAVEFGGGGTRPRARHRGRVYLGPLQGGTNTETEDSTTHEVTILNGLRSDATKAATQFDAALAASPLNGTTWSWVQFSDTDWVARPVKSTWMDNAFDVQRRRAQKATGRTTQAIG